MTEYRSDTQLKNELLTKVLKFLAKSFHFKLLKKNIGNGLRTFLAI